MRAPGFSEHPNHEVILEQTNDRVKVLFGKTTIADTSAAIQVKESRHANVYYLPLSDVNQKLLSPSHTTTYCPFKGTARYWDVVTGKHAIRDAIWGYPEPYDECIDLAEYVSVYTDKLNQIVEHSR